LVKWWRGVDATARRWEATVDAKAPEWESAANARATEVNAYLHRTTTEHVRRALSSVEAAALSGIGAAVMLSLSTYLLARQPGVGSSRDDLAWYADSGNRFTVFVGLNLAPFGIVAFLWFMAVVRRRLGPREDQFFSTVFLGSGIALGFLTIAAATCAAAPTLVVHFGGEASLDKTTVALAHGLWFGLWGVSASRLVGVFMAATSTIGLRFGALPRWLARLGLLLGALLGITGAFAGPLDFIFPAWLVIVSVTLVVTRRRRDLEAAEADS